MSEYSDLITSTSPVAWYRLNSASGTDSSGNSRTLTWTNSPTAYATDPLANDSDGAADFDGSNDYGTIADADVFSPYTNSNFTVEFWANPDSNHVGALIQKPGEWGLGWGEGGSSNQFFCFIQKTDFNMVKYASESGTSSYGTWYHIAMVWNGTTVKLYKNGVDVTYMLADNAVTGMGNTSASIYVGHNSSLAQKYDGKMDEIAIYNTALSSTEILKHYEVGIGRSTYQSQASTPAVTFTPYAATVTVEGTVNITADLATVTFTPYAPNVTTTVVVSPDLVTVTFTPYNPTVTADNTNTLISFDGVIQDYISDLGYISGTSAGGSYDVNGVYYDPYLGGGSVSSYKGYQFILTVPEEAVLNALVTITASANFVNNLYGNQGIIDIYDLDGGSPSTIHNAIALTASGTGTDSDTRALTLGNIGFNWIAGNRYKFYIYFATSGSISNGNTVQLDSLTLYYETGTAVSIDADNVPEITFTPYNPTVASGQQTNLTVDNVAAVTITGFDADVGTPGSISVGTTLSTVAFTSYDSTISTTSTLEQVVTNAPAVEFITYAPTVDPNLTALSFKWISKNCPCRTAADSSAISSIDLGSGLFNQELTFAFKLGNTSSSTCDFTISASSVNNLEDMVTFSTTKDGTYTSSVTIESITSNRVTDVIWGKLTIDTDAIVDDGTFLIHVEQTNA